MQIQRLYYVSLLHEGDAVSFNPFLTRIYSMENIYDYKSAELLSYAYKYVLVILGYHSTCSFDFYQFFLSSHIVNVFTFFHFNVLMLLDPRDYCVDVYQLLLFPRRWVGCRNDECE